MCNSFEKFNNLILNHLQNKNLLTNNRTWRIDVSSIEGRGVFVEEDIQTNEVIFIDHPVILGPRAPKNVKLHCVVCSSSTNDLQVCPKKCGLPLCETCSDSPKHWDECNFILQHMLTGKKFDEISEDVFRSLTPLRSLFINEESKELVRNLVCHFEDKRHGFELELLKKHIALKPEEEAFIKISCSVLDSNAFETIVYHGTKITSLRGLYPLSSIMNHNCSPNTCYLFDSQQNIIVRAAVPIKKGEEIFVTYSTPFWGTQLRRHYLAATKHFWCRCNRCSDPEEFGTQLGALKCIINNCEGVILPIDPLKITSKWKCSVCDISISSQKICILESVIKTLLAPVNTKDPDQLIPLIKERLKTIIPASNHITIELKLKVVWMLGHKENFKWKDLSLDQLVFKEKLCRDILKLIENLHLGQCTLRGLLLRELYQCKTEFYQRQNVNGTETNSSVNEVQNDLEDILKESMVILEYDAYSLQKNHT